MREQSLLDYVYQSNPALPGRVAIPPGDDMGAVRIGRELVLVTVDQVADGVHVDLASAGLARTGRKAITRNLSDVAAMAAKPAGAVAAVCLPRDFGDERAKALFDAMRETAEAFDCPLVGGDISMWAGRLIATVTIFADPAGVEPVQRKGAQVGDSIYVTGELGGSLEDVAGCVHHLEFTPRIDLARKLASEAHTRPSCMIDLSDGIARDLPRICKASGVAAEIDSRLLPISPAGRQASERTGQPAWRHAVGDGEDYELLMTAPPGALPPEVDGVAITEIGRIVAAEAGGERVTLRLTGGETADLRELGWEHGT
ncbi:MAG: thiamine-phosphate kinase [Phycisphaeraceae bacterium]